MNKLFQSIFSYLVDPEGQQVRHLLLHPEHLRDPEVPSLLSVPELLKVRAVPGVPE